MNQIPGSRTDEANICFHLPQTNKGKDGQTDTPCCPVQKTPFQYQVLQIVREGRGHIHHTHPHGGRLHTSSERVRPGGGGRCRENTIGVTEVEKGNYLFVLRPNSNISLNQLQPYQSNFLNEQRKISLLRFQWQTSSQLKTSKALRKEQTPKKEGRKEGRQEGS